MKSKNLFEWLPSSLTTIKYRWTEKFQLFKKIKTLKHRGVFFLSKIFVFFKTVINVLNSDKIAGNRCISISNGKVQQKKKQSIFLFFFFVTKTFPKLNALVILLLLFRGQIRTYFFSHFYYIHRISCKNHEILNTHLLKNILIYLFVFQLPSIVLLFFFSESGEQRFVYYKKYMPSLIRSVETFTLRLLLNFSSFFFLNKIRANRFIVS